MFAGLQVKAQHILSENASAILTATGVAGTVGTAILTGRAAFKAALLIEVEEDTTNEELDKKTKVMMVGPLFIPAVGLGSATIASIIMANRLSAKKAAALAAAYGLSERRFEEYKNKAREKLGVNKEQKLREEVAQDRVSKDQGHQVIMVGDGDVLFYDQLTGRYFKSTVEKVKKAMTTIQGEIYKHMFASLSHFFEELDVEPTVYTEMVGWNVDNYPEVVFTTTITSDDRPCIVLEFDTMPVQEYARLHG